MIDKTMLVENWHGKKPVTKIIVFPEHNKSKDIGLLIQNYPFRPKSKTIKFRKYKGMK